MNKNLSLIIRPLSLIFIFTTAFFISGKSWLVKKEIDQTVLLAGNLLLFATTMVSAWIIIKGAASPNPQAAVRAMYSSFLVKFFLVAIAAFTYIMVAKKGVSIPALIICAALYIIYTTVEVRSLLKLMKQKKNA